MINYKRKKPEEPCFIIAEAGVNHNGDIALAKEMVIAAARAGVDAIKFQTFIPEKLVSTMAEKAEYQKVATGDNESQIDMIRKLQLPLTDFLELKELSIKIGLIFISTPFDFDSAHYLNSIGMKIFKIPSGEITNLAFLREIASFGKPIILSTGMSTLSEVDVAVRCLQDNGCKQLALLHCVSNYPASPKDTNLRAIITMREAFGLSVGYSDHTLGFDIALASVAIGATILEKHFTLDKKMNGPDHQASIDVNELKNLVEKVRMIESAMGNGIKSPANSENNTAQVARRSLFANRDINAGKIIEPKDIIALRPSGGIPPNLVDFLIGKTTKMPIRNGDMIRFSDFN